MKQPSAAFLSSERLHRPLLAALATLSLAFIALFFSIAFRRMHFPLQLEWLEGGVLDTAVRVLHHQAIYVQPTYHFVPNIYTPLFFYLAAPALKLLGTSLATVRLVSTLCTAGCFALLFTQARILTRSALAGLLSAGLFAALYGSVDAWYDLARIDMLFVLLTLAAILLSCQGHAVLSALAFVLAYQAKQGAGIIAVFVLLHELEQPRRIVIGLTTFFAGIAASIFLLNHQSHGWYSYYTLTLPSHHTLVPLELISFFTRGLFARLGLALAIICLGVVFSHWRSKQNARLACFLIATTTGTFLSALSGRIHSGGSVNVMLPLYAWLCVLFGIAFAILLRTKIEDTIAPRLQTVVLIMGIMQFCALVYPTEKILPTRQATQQAQLAYNTIAATPGDLYVLGNTIDLASANKQTFANSVAVFDVLRADHGPIAAALKQDLSSAIAQHRFAALIAPGALGPGFLYDGSSAQLADDYAGTGTTVLTPANATELEKIVPAPIAPGVIHFSK
jgi:hypothetical protein